MWASIGAVLEFALPLLLKLVMAIIERKQNNDKLRAEFLRFIALIENQNISVKMDSRYQDQLARINEELAKENQNVPRSTL
jgi:hypothetical protein